MEIVQEDRLQSAHPQVPPQLLLLPVHGLSLLGGVMLGHLGEHLDRPLLHVLGAGHLELPHLPHHNHLLTEDAGRGQVLVTRVRVELTNRVGLRSPEIVNVLEVRVSLSDLENSLFALHTFQQGV